MAKGIGLIGNFKGKVGNTVGYKLSASNTGNTQGIRIYQPIVRNPKTSAQAEQRAKLAPINATYRALKMVIDRGNEGLPYGNKSRLAWLKGAFKAEHMPWFVKGAAVGMAVGCQLTKGSLAGVQFKVDGEELSIIVNGVTDQTPLTTVGALSTALLSGYSQLKAGDQITFVQIGNENGTIITDISSFVIDTTSKEAIKGFVAGTGTIAVPCDLDLMAGSIIISREGSNGEHLRSTSAIKIQASLLDVAPYDATSKAAAIASYQASANGNADWAEESIQ